MKNISEAINPAFLQCLEKGIKKAPDGTKFIAVHVSSWHMSIFYEFYTNCRGVEKALAQPLLDPMCYSTIKLVWAVEEQELVFYNAMGFVSAAHAYWKENKDDPNAIETKCIGNVKDILNSQPSHPNIKKDHLCQADPGAPEICYFCGGPVVPVDTSKTTLNIFKPKNEEEEEEEDKPPLPRSK